MCTCVYIYTCIIFIDCTCLYVIYYILYLYIIFIPIYTTYTPLCIQFPRLVEHNPMIAAECLALIYNNTTPALTSTSITTITHTTLTTTITGEGPSHDTGSGTGNVNLPSEARIQPYLDVLLTMDMNLQNVEVVNKLITLIEVPLEFVYKYITLCMSECTNIKDKYLQVKCMYEYAY